MKRLGETLLLRTKHMFDRENTTETNYFWCGGIFSYV